MKHLIILVVALINTLSVNHAIGQSGNSSVNEASPNISSCTDHSLVEVTKNNWSGLDTIRTLGLVQASASPMSDSYPEPSNWEWVAFQGFVNDNWEILRARPKEYGDYVFPDQLTKNKASDVRPKLTRDASRIAFVSHREGNDDIFTMNIDGSGLNRLTFSSSIDTMPSWSPDDSKLLFVSTRNGNADLFVMDANGANLRQLTTVTADDIFPSWSPDGKQITWVQIQGQVRVLWVANMDGSNAHAITGNLRLLQNPAWAPNGTEIAFDFDSDDPDSFNEIGVVAVDGTNFRKYTTSNSQSTDLWVSGWTAKGNAVTLTYVSWFCPEGVPLAEFEIGYAETKNDGWPTVWEIVGQNAMPAHRSQDISPPDTRVLTLPKFSRARFLNPQWAGIDLGPSGLVRVDVGVRYEGSSDWFLWQYISMLNKKLYFRSQGVDEAGNIEPWPASEQGDAQTEPFDWKITGKTTDNRAAPLPNVEMVFSPPAAETVKTELDGNYVAHLRGETGFTINETTSLNFGGDGTYLNYTVPDDNVMRDGSFEESIVEANWNISDSSVVKLDRDIYHDRFQSVRLGFNCNVTCLKSEAIDSTKAGANYLLKMLVAPDGTIHLFGQDRFGNPIYGSRDPSGNYSQLIQPFGRIVNGKMVAALDRSNNLHVVIVTAPGQSEREILYAERLSDGSWTSPQKIANGLSPRLMVDQQGVVHVVHQCYLSSQCSPDGIYHLQRSQTGNWNSSTLILKSQIPESVTENYQLIQKTNNQVSVFVDNNFVQLSPTGEPIQTVSLDLPPSSFHIPILPVNEGISYLLYPAGGSFIIQLNNQTSWDHDALWLSDKYGGSMAVDDQERIHMIDLNSGNYLLRNKDGIWYDRMSLNRSLQDFHVYKSGDIILLQNTLEGQAILSQAQATETLSSVISQAVTIPTALHNPTLSFMYELMGPSADHSSFEVFVRDSITNTQIFSTSESTPWKLGWVDMSRWSNQTVTITFSLHQAKDDPLKALYLDQISLGSWLTAVPKSVAPDQFDVGKTPQVIATGDNFIATPELFLGTTKLSDVQWLDENHIAFTPPSDLKAGMYDLFIQNPGAPQTVLVSALRVGKQIYLPLVAK